MSTAKVEVAKQYIIVLTTTDNAELADSIASSLIDNDIAACVQIDEVTSYFKWQGKLSKQQEYRLMIKARADRYNEVESNIAKLHTYKIPQIIKIDITGGLPAYLQWLDQ